MPLTNEIKYRLLAGRLERDYASNPDAGLSCGPRKVHVSLGRVWEADNQYCHSESVHLFAFGAHDATYVLAFGYLEDALEDAAATLREVAPGCFVDVDGYEDARAGMELEFADDCRRAAAKLFCSTFGDLSEGQQAEVYAYLGKSEVSDEEVQEYVEQDLTYTESGWLPSWEWTIVGSGMSPEEIRAWAKNEG